jgi:hypothetical protein
MRCEEVIERLRLSPFRPFRPYVSDGGTFDIRHPEMLMITRHSAIIGIVEGGSLGSAGNGGAGGAYPRIGRSTQVALLHATRVEDLQQPERRAS